MNEPDDFNFVFNPATFNTGLFSCHEDLETSFEAFFCTLCLVSEWTNDRRPSTTSDRGNCCLHTAMATVVSLCGFGLLSIPIIGGCSRGRCHEDCKTCHVDFDRFRKQDEQHPTKNDEPDCLGCIVGSTCPWCHFAQVWREKILRDGKVRHILLLDQTQPRMLYTCCCQEGKGNYLKVYGKKYQQFDQVDIARATAKMKMFVDDEDEFPKIS